MGLRYFTLIAGLLFAANAMAITVPRAQAPENCDKTPFQANLRDLQEIDFSKLVHKAAVAKDDTRIGLNKFKPKTLPKINKVEGALLQKAVGSCTCSLLGDTKVDVRSSCFLAGTRGTNTQVHFNAHFAQPFFHGNGVQKAGALTCTFANKAGDAPVEFSFTPGSFRLGTLNAEDEINDRAVVRLSRPVPGAIELPVIEGAAKINEGMPLYLLSAEQLRMKVQVGSDQPIAQEVKVVKVYRDEAGKVVAFATTGSTTLTASGSVYLMRDSDGGLAAVGMLQGGSKDERDGQPVFRLDPKTGEVLRDQNGQPRLNNANIAIPMSPNFSAEDKQMADGSGSADHIAPAATKGL